MRQGNKQASATATLAIIAGIALGKKAVEVDLPPVKRGRPPLPPRLHVRKDRGGEHGMGCILHLGQRRSFGITADNKEACEAAVKVRERSDLGKAIGKIDHEAVPLSTILADWLAEQHRKFGGTVYGEGQVRQMANQVERLLRFFGQNATLGQVNPARCREYVGWLKAQLKDPSDPARGHYAEGTAFGDLRRLRSAVLLYKESAVIWMPRRVVVPGRSKPRKHYLTRSQVARILASAIWGWVWDPDSRDWATETIVDPETGRATGRRKVDAVFRKGARRARWQGRMLARFILIGVYTGTRLGHLWGLSWARHPNHGHIDVRTGILHRCGSVEEREAIANKQNPNVEMPPSLARLVVRWHGNDRSRNARFVIQRHGHGGRSYECGETLYVQYKAAARRAALGNSIVHELRHTTMTWVTEETGSDAVAARFIGVSPDIGRRTYSHAGVHATHIAAQALGNMARKRDELSTRDLEAEKPRGKKTIAEATAARLARSRKLGVMSEATPRPE